MPLFDIPGWSVTAYPAPEASIFSSKKRKRPSSDPSKLQSAEVNLEKLVKKLKGSSSVDVQGKYGERKGPRMELTEDKRKTGKEKEKPKSRSVVVEERRQTISRPKPLKAIEKDSHASSRPTKKAKTKHTGQPPSSPAAAASVKSLDAPTGGLTALQRQMKQSLNGARFRLINETMYKTDSHEAHQMMKADPQVFEDYHTGFRHQVQVWPTNPVEHYIASLSAYPQQTVIADLGCGDAALARALAPKGMNVLSFDLVSDGAFVVEADICSKIPLPGSEGTEDEKSGGEGHVVDVVVCALSLMGTNWPSCLREAWRILKPGGELKVAEVASRFTDIEGFITLVGLIGFQLRWKDDSNSHFTLFEYRKISRRRKGEKEWRKLMSRADLLRPCEYKRR